MPFWPYFFIAALVSFVVDRSLGLAHLLTGFAVLFVLFGLAGAAGVNIFDYGPVVEILVILIFTPITVRLFFVLRAQRAGGGEIAGVGGPGDRNAERAYKAMWAGANFFKLFTFNFITGGLVIASVATLVGWIEPDGKLVALSVVGYPFAASFIADALGVTGIGKILWGTVGLVLGVAFSLFVTLAAMALHA